MRPVATCLLPLLLLLFGLNTDVRAEGWFGHNDFDPEVPTMETVLGHAMGERISSSEHVQRYFEALAEAQPDRIRLINYGTSWQGRPLIYAIIGTPQRIADLDAIQADIQMIAHPDEHDQADIEAALERVPSTAWLSYAVHGNEISPSDAAMVTAWYLLAARNDEVAQNILANSLVFIAPLQNPDGRARFVNEFESNLGLEPDPSRLSAERNERWPGGRVNHYLFDLNRDWLPLTQPETQGHVAALLDWFPLAMVDAHEMGTDTTFFFAPEAEPFNPLLTASQRESLTAFGRNNARWFDRYGYAYFTREIFDAFYPGYGASWPSYYGGIAMTYEQASARGLVARKRHGEVITYGQTVVEYVAASLATLETVANRRDELWGDFAEYRSSALEQARDEGPAAWVIPAQPDQGGADKLAQVIARHGSDVFRIEEAMEACALDLAAGSYVIPSAQPSYRQLRVLLDEQIDMPDEFLADQERRRARGEADQIYDVTGWSLPLMFNVDIERCRRAPSTAGLTAVDIDAGSVGRLDNADARLAFVAPGGSTATLRLLAAGLQAGLTIDRAQKGFELNGTRYPAGSLIFQQADNSENLSNTLEQLAQETGATVTGTDNSWIIDGPSFGSNQVRRLHAPRVALAWDQPTSPNSTGAVRFILERQIGYPVTVIRTQTLRAADLNRFDVVILPDASPWLGGGYGGVLGGSGASMLKDWVEDGGTLVTLAGGTAWAASPNVDLLASRPEHSSQSSDENAIDGEQSRVSGVELESLDDLDERTRAGNRPPDSVAGVLVNTDVDTNHWLATGVAEQVPALVRGRRIFSPPSRDQGEIVARYAGPDELLASGYLWEENRRQLAFKPFLMTQYHGRGHIVAFTEDPSVRAYLDGLNGLLVNAVLVAPAYSRKLR
ncbi:MAG: M14 metallopeptidase family protein [Pseudomonadota bacterium]